MTGAATTGGIEAETPASFSVVTVTYARDDALALSLAATARLIGDRDDVETVLVDNNPDDVDRSGALSGARRPVYVKLGRNKGVSARNDGAAAAGAPFVLFVDDDTELGPPDALGTYAAAFAADPGLAIVSARHVDVATGLTPRASFPHTDKSLPRDVAMLTFRFQGNGFAVRREAWDDVGPMSEDFFYGLEEIDYAYRVIERGWRIRYEPSIVALEHNHPGGRRPRRAVEEMRLTNKMIISWKHMPSRHLATNIALFSGYVFVLNRGRLNVLASAWAFARWVRANPGRRRPIGRVARDYIAACGGDVSR